MTTYNNLVVLILAGDPVSTSNPQIEAITTAVIEDLGDGNANTTTTHFEENAYGPLVPTTQSVTIDGLIYDASGRVGDDLLNITSDGGGTIYGINGWVAELFDVSGSNPTKYVFFVVAGETLPSDITTNTTSYQVHSGGVNSGASMPYASVMTSSIPTTDQIVTGTSGDDVIDVTYTGDSDGDLVDNDDGNPTSADGNDDSIVAGDGNDTINGGMVRIRCLGKAGMMSSS